MNIIEQATKRLEELRRGGVEVPWEASRLSEEQFNELVKASSQGAGSESSGARPIEAIGSEAALPKATNVRSVAPRRSETIEIDLAALERSGLLVPNIARSELALEFRGQATTAEERA